MKSNVAKMLPCWQAMHRRVSRGLVRCIELRCELGWDMPGSQNLLGRGREFAEETLYPPVKGATVAILDQVANVITKDPSIGEIVFRLEHVEPPSVELAIELMLDRAGSKLRFSCLGESELAIDPRTSTARISLWEFGRSETRPAIQPPDQAQVEACARIARKSQDCMQSWEHACDVFESLDSADVESWLSVMVHPPQTRADIAIVQWLRRVQLAAAQLAVMEEQKQKIVFDESKVADLTRGPLDWTIDASLVALAQRACCETSLVPRVRQLAQDVLGRIPEGGTWSCKEVALAVMQYLDVVSCEGSN